MIVNSLVEGPLDEAVAKRIVTYAGHQIGACYGRNGVGYIKTKIKGFNQAAHAAPILTLVDLRDTGMRCPSEVREAWVPNQHPRMVFRLVVQEIESWLLADRKGMAKFLGVPVAKVPDSVEEIEQPKVALVNVARKSRSKKVIELLVPENGLSVSVGRQYVSEMIRFATDIWDVDAARAESASLDACVNRLAALT
ncbi:DUF4276 family protein [Burkholderia stagnalis]|uniref:DUF4276 family protein n=1 Tax=Burkholderia stagnalis TaxID=1503054 RepID=UPI0009C063CD|nr:DUF4276 family protein [Burkholderia stagnalis]